MKYYLIMFLMLFATSAFAEVETRSKPVQCGGIEGLLTIIDQAEEKALLGALGEVTMPDMTKQILPIYVFANTDTGTFTIFEMHPESNEVCLIGYGNSLDFDVQRYFEPKTNS